MTDLASLSISDLESESDGSDRDEGCCTRS